MNNHSTVNMMETEDCGTENPGVMSIAAVAGFLQDIKKEMQEIKSNVQKIQDKEAEEVSSAVLDRCKDDICRSG